MKCAHTLDTDIENIRKGDDEAIFYNVSITRCRFKLMLFSLTFMYYTLLVKERVACDATSDLKYWVQIVFVRYSENKFNAL